jgi:hypothetical protein
MRTFPLTRRRLRGQNPQMGKASPADAAAGHFRAGDQSQDPQGVWIDDPATLLARADEVIE